MAGSRYAYVKAYELADTLLPGVFIVARLDGRGFHRFAEEHAFLKPSDDRALHLMDHAARAVADEFKDVILAFGESDEYSFLFRRMTTLYNRRHSKILTALTSSFTARYVFHWPEYFPDTPLKYPPSFDGRTILYPTEKEVKDYFSWRQTDTHINNLYNTAFWALVQEGGESTATAHAKLKGTVSSQKQDLLFTRFDTNYNKLPARLRKGTILVRETAVSNVDENPSAIESPLTENSIGAPIYETQDDEHPHASAETTSSRKPKTKGRNIISTLHIDIIGDKFWKERPELLL